MSAIKIVLEIVRRGHEPNGLFVENAFAELAAMQAVVDELKGTAKHKMSDGSFCWCDRHPPGLPSDFGHGGFCSHKRDALKALDGE